MLKIYFLQLRFQQTVFKTVLFLFLSNLLFAGGVRGIVKNQKGEIMPFASVLVKGTDIGTMANAEGKYEIKLNEGKHELIFQFVGYQALTKQIEIKKDFETLNVVMVESVIQLSEATVKSNNEDPALTIMRKTIAMSPYHHKEIESLIYRNYVRGSFRVDDVPFLLEGQMKKNFITKGQTYVLEAVHEVKFKQPNSTIDKVLSVRSNFPPPMKGQESISSGRINFYNPNDENSPITAKGAIYYKYVYLGFFEDKGLTVNKIKVIPKTKNPGYYSGVMNIIDGSWYLHSVDFTTKEEVGNSNLKVIFTNIQDIWLPIQADISIKADVFGVEGSIRFTTAFKNYQLVKNPKYATIKPQVLDDKIFKTEAKDLNAQKIDKKKIALQKELTVKQLKGMMKEMEKEEVKEKKEKKEEIIDREFSRSEDSLARKKSEEFWETERQVPLTEIETIGYRKADSLYKVDEKKISIKIKEDSIDRSRPARFKVNHLWAGNTYRYTLMDKKDKSKGYKHYFTLGNWFENTRYNAVEGYNIGIPSLGYRRRFDSLRSFNFTLTPQYSINRERVNGSFQLGYSQKSFGGAVEFGRKVQQINNEQPISNLLNTAFSLLNNQHYGKFFEQKYIIFYFNPRINDRFRLNTQLQIAERYHLQNIENQGFRKKPEQFYESNDPIHESKIKTAFSTNTQTKFTASLTFRPFMRVNKYNGRKYFQAYGPYFRISNIMAFGESGFNRIEAAVTHEFKVGLSNVSVRAETGTFYGKKPKYFLDYKHFNGNKLFFQPHDEFRDLPYYQYSSQAAYLQFFGKVDFRRLLLTQLPFIQKKGWEEKLFANILTNKHVSHLELGYGLSAFLGAFKGEIYGVFDNKGYNHAGFRLYLPIGKNAMMGF